MSIQPPAPGTPPLPEAGSLRCPRCSATIGPEQDWCLECGAPARTRLAQTPNWQLPTVAIGAIVLLAGAMLAFAFVKLTDDGGAPASTTPTVTAAVPVTPPAEALPTAPTTTPAPAATTPTTPAATTPTTTPATTTPSTTTPATTTPATTTPTAPSTSTPAATPPPAPAKPSRTATTP